MGAVREATLNSHRLSGGPRGGCATTAHGLHPVNSSYHDGFNVLAARILSNALWLWPVEVPVAGLGLQSTSSMVIARHGLGLPWLVFADLVASR
jgi:hypothetical protein